MNLKFPITIKGCITFSYRTAKWIQLFSIDRMHFRMLSEICLSEDQKLFEVLKETKKVKNIRAIPLNMQYKNNFHTRTRTVPIHVHRYNVLSSSCHPLLLRIYKHVPRNECLISMLLRPNPTLFQIILLHLFL